MYANVNNLTGLEYIADAKDRASMMRKTAQAHGWKNMVYWF